MKITEKSTNPSTHPENSKQIDGKYKYLDLEIKKSHLIVRSHGHYERLEIYYKALTTPAAQKQVTTHPAA